MGLELAFKSLSRLANGFAALEEPAPEEAEEAEEVEEAETQSEMAEAPGLEEVALVEMEIGTKTVGSALETFRERAPWIGKSFQPPVRPRPFRKYFLL